MTSAQTATKQTLKYNCICGFGTDNNFEFSRHFAKAGRTEPGQHRSLVSTKANVVPEIQDFESQAIKEAKTRVEQGRYIKVTICPDCKGDVLWDNVLGMYQCASCINRWNANKELIDTPPVVTQEVKEVPVIALPIETPKSKGWFHKNITDSKGVKQSEVISQAKVQTETIPQIKDAGNITWNPQAKKPKNNLTTCIVIDGNGGWHPSAKLDLKGRDMSACTWGYYGQRLPVLVETDDGLQPFILSDVAGAESPHRLFIAAKSTSYKSYMIFTSDFLRKIQIGLMALLVFGIMFLIYILINSGTGGGGAI